jgi:hypothetical protein
MRGFPIHVNEIEKTWEIDWTKYGTTTRRQIERFVAFGSASTTNGMAHDFIGFLTKSQPELKFMQTTYLYLPEKDAVTLFPELKDRRHASGIRLSIMEVTKKLSRSAKPLIDLVQGKAGLLRIENPSVHNSFITREHDAWNVVFGHHSQTLIASRAEFSLQKLEKMITLPELWEAQEEMGEHRAHIKMPWDQ